MLSSFYIESQVKYLPHLILSTMLTLFFLHSSAVAAPLFDTHLHYSESDAEKYSPADIIKILDRNDIAFAAVTGSPASHVIDLHSYAPGRIIPLLSIYKQYSDKSHWINDESIPALIESELRRNIWRGIGEIHIFARDRNSPVFRRVIEIATSHDLPLLIHGDPAVIDRVFSLSPKLKLIWAHAGKYPYPEIVSDYLERYDSLSVDLSMRDERIAPSGELADDWYELLVRYPDRFLLGVDTYSTQRWDDFDSAVRKIRRWLSQLPEEVRLKLAYENASAIYDVSSKDYSTINHSTRDHSVR